MKERSKTILKSLFTLGWIGVFLFAGLMVYWFYRPNTSYINSSLGVQTWDASADGTHNSNTELTYFNGYFYLVHANSPIHWGTPESKLIIKKSQDAITWTQVATLNFEGNDIRDPKCAIIGGKLFIYALRNTGIIAAPHATYYTTTTDGVNWTAWLPVNQAGWLFWRPKTSDGGTTWYVPAYWHEHGICTLFKSTDGITWTTVSEIYRGESCDETAIEFLTDGRMIVTSRLEGLTELNIFGDATGSTLISVSSAPFTTWTQIKSTLTRLDGPCLFTYNGRTYAVGRYEPEVKGTFSQTGSFFNKKRTSLFELKTDQLVYLSDLPSAGDTSYVGAVMKSGFLYLSYYTSDITKDYVWVMGQITPTNVRMAKIPLASLDTVASAPPGLPDDGIKWDSIILTIGIIGVIILVLLRTKPWKKIAKNR